MTNRFCNYSKKVDVTDSQLGPKLFLQNTEQNNTVLKHVFCIRSSLTPKDRFRWRVPPKESRILRPENGCNHFNIQSGCYFGLDLATPKRTFSKRKLNFCHFRRILVKYCHKLTQLFMIFLSLDN